MTLSKQAKLRIPMYFVAGAIVLWLVLLSSTHYDVTFAIKMGIISLQGGDLLDRTMKKYAPGAVNCGRVETNADPEPATRCALDAFEGKRAFHVRYDLQGIDSAVAIGLVGAMDGGVRVILFDGDPMGQEYISLFRQRVDEGACPAPVNLFRSPNGRLNCFKPDPKAQRNIMSPTFEAY